MTLEGSLSRASLDVERGDLGKARDRLEGLLVAYPDSMEIRRLLGEIYWRLQYPERAGRHWYLLPSESPDMDAAKAAFARRYGNSPWLMLESIRYYGGLDSIRGTYADGVLRDLASRARVSDARLERVLRRREPGQRDPTPAQPWWGRLVMAGCLVVAIAIGVLALVGWYALAKGLL